MRKLFTLLTLTLVLAASCAQAQEADFVNAEANHISLNGDDWSGVRQSLRNSKSWHGGKWQAVHIGDSHVQPGIFTDQVRKAFQRKWGNGGRGLLTPLSIAKTNEPADYVLKATGVADYSRLISRNWTTDMGLTGIAVRFGTDRTDLWVRAKSAADRFSRVTLLHAEGEGYETAMVCDSLIFGRRISGMASLIDLGSPTDTVAMTVPCPTDFWGVVLSNNKNGVMVHNIGINGATYASYNRVPGFSGQLQLLEPQIIIISLGTNEAFGNTSMFEANMDRLVRALRKDNPKAKILLTTPMECHKQTSTKVPTRVTTGKGRRARTKTIYKKVSSYAPNPGVGEVRQMILNYGRRHKIATWDLYEVAGGEGAAQVWIDQGLMNARDHIHQLNRGYELQGRLLAEALMEILN